MAYPQLCTDEGADTPDLERDIADVLRTLHVDEREAWRRKDAIKGKIHVVRHLESLIRGAHRANRPVDDVLRLAAVVEGFTLDLYANDPLASCWISAFRVEQQVNSETDLLQFEVFERRGDRAAFPAVLRRAEAAFTKQRIASGLCERAVRHARLTGAVA